MDAAGMGKYGGWIWLPNEMQVSERGRSIHDGNIGVERELSKGSTFWFTLPTNAEV